MICTQWIIAGAAGVVISAGSVGTAENLARKLADAEITEQVMHKVATNDPSVASRVVISTHAGVVTLSGGKMTPGDILLMTRDATETAGVVRVEDRLTLM